MNKQKKSCQIGKIRKTWDLCNNFPLHQQHFELVFK